MPFGELCDLIAIEQIKNEGAKRKKTQTEEKAEFFRLQIVFIIISRDLRILMITTSYYLKCVVKSELNI